MGGGRGRGGGGLSDGEEGASATHFLKPVPTALTGDSSE
jgi:hypothetical protein